MILILALIILGFVLRIGQYFANRSLWIDEAALAMSIVHKPLSALFQPLELDQSAPVGFIFLEKIAILFFGTSEYVIRFFPLVASLVSIILFYKVVKYTLKKRASIIALMLFVISEFLIYYASEVKQYSFDVLISLLLLYLFVIFQKKEEQRSKNIVLLGIVGCIAVWFSQPAIFTLLAIVLALLLWEKQSQKFILISFFWLVSFTAKYILVLRPYFGNKGLVDYWNLAFAPFPPTNSMELGWYKESLISLFNNPLGFQFEYLALVFFSIGIYFYLKYEKKALLLLISPIFFALFASMLQLYPFTDRFLLFTVPMNLIIIAVGIDTLLSLRKQYLYYFSLILIVILFWYPSLNAFSRLLLPRTKEEIRPAIQYFIKYRRQSDILYVYYGAITQFQYYALRQNIEKLPYISGIGRTENITRYREELQKLDGNKRVWILFSHVVAINGWSEEDFFIQYFDSIGRRLDFFKAKGASLYLYDFTKKD